VKVTSAIAEPRRRPRPPRYYIHRVVCTAADPPLTSVIPHSFNDLIAAWQQAGQLRRQQPDAMFIVGEMCLDATPRPGRARPAPPL
jgi:hypothetical protein